MIGYVRRNAVLIAGFGVLLYMFLPIFVVVLMSFNQPASRQSYSFDGFTLGAWGDGDTTTAYTNEDNNSETGGAMIPLLTLGIPGSGSTAVMLFCADGASSFSTPMRPLSPPRFAMPCRIQDCRSTVAPATRVRVAPRRRLPVRR